MEMQTPPEHITRLFTAGVAAANKRPVWWYNDLYGQKQGPFDPDSMARWCAKSELPMDLLCCGVHHLDRACPPSNLQLFRPLAELLAEVESGKDYRPVRTAPTPVQGSPLVNNQQASKPAASPQTVSRTWSNNDDLTLQGDQRSMPNRPQQQQQQQQWRASPTPPTRASPSPGAAGTPQQRPPFPMTQGAPAAAAVSAPPAAGGEGAPELVRGSPAWNAALQKLLSREGFSGKDADVKWRVILPSGDRVGPFSGDQLLSWLLNVSIAENSQHENAYSMKSRTPSCYNRCCWGM